MPFVRQIFGAGSVVSLPFLLLVSNLLSVSLSSQAKEQIMPTLQEFASSCIDLGCYDAKERQLTVRFVNRDNERFYRYSNVPGRIWKKLNALNQTGGVGGYLNDAVLQHPEKYPFKELAIHSFKTVPKKQKAGNSK
jgi:hypothetical protein